MIPFILGFGFNLAPHTPVSGFVLLWDGCTRQFVPVTPPSHL